GKAEPRYARQGAPATSVGGSTAEKPRAPGNKPPQKLPHRHSGYPGGLRSRTLRAQLERRPTEVIRKAVKGMLPKNKLASAQIGKLKIYAGPDHPHEAQAPEPLDLSAVQLGKAQPHANNDSD